MTKKVFTIIGLVLAAILFLVCVAIDIWYLYILFIAPQKYVPKTYEIGMQTTADGSVTKNLIEVKYFSNKNKNGLECFEFKLNYLLDEDKSGLYSQGIQFVVNDNDKNLSINNSFKFEYDFKDAEHVDRKYSWFSNQHLRDIEDFYFSSFEPCGSNFSKYEYASYDDYKNTIIDSNKITDDTGFKITMGSGENEEIYLMKLKGKNTPISNSSLYASTKKDAKFLFINFGRDIDSYYSYYNINYLMNIIFNSISSIKTGSTETLVFQFGDLFDYYKYDKEKGTYSEDKVVETSKIENYILTYCSISVTVSDDGVSRVDNSLFNCVHGKQTFNLNNDNYTTDYLTGQTFYKATLKDFELVYNETGNYDIKLSDNFVKRFSDYEDEMFLNVELDYITTFEAAGLKVNTPTTESYRGFKVNSESIKRTHIISGGGMIA